MKTHPALMVLVLLALAGCGGSSDSGGAGTATTDAARTTTTAKPAADTVTLTDPGSRFRITVPAGYALSVRKGVYVMRKGPATLTYSRVTTPTSPAAYQGALRRDAAARVDDSWVGRDGPRLVVLTGRSAGLDEAGLARIAGTASGGYALTPPPARAATMALRSYRAPDGGATGLVPSEPGWTINSSGGNLEGSGAKGSFLFGFSYDVTLPENTPQGAPGVHLPYADAKTALTQVIPGLNPSAHDLQVVATEREGVLPSFTSSGLYRFTYTVGGKPWVGVAAVATDSPAKYSNFLWKFYYSGIGVPAGSDPAVGAGLLKAWRAWNPSGAIAQRSARSRQLMDETAGLAEQTSEFRARQADRQSRDVGCLLQGYSDVEDNSRKHDLAPLPCGQAYVP